MPVLTSSGEVMPRNAVYGALLLKPKRNKVRIHKKKRRTLPVQKSKHVISKRQAQVIMDRQIVRKLQQMF